MGIFLFSSSFSVNKLAALGQTEREAKFVLDLLRYSLARAPGHSNILNHCPQSQILLLIWESWGQKVVPYIRNVGRP